jgi:hypothetical protein
VVEWRVRRLQTLQHQPSLPALTIHTCYLQAAAATRCGGVGLSLDLVRNNDVVKAYFCLVAYYLFSQPPPPWTQSTRTYTATELLFESVLNGRTQLCRMLLECNADAVKLWYRCVIDAYVRSGVYDYNC